MTINYDQVLSEVENAKMGGNNKRVIDLLEELVESQRGRIEHLESDLRVTDREFDIQTGAQGVTIHNLTTKIVALEKEIILLKAENEQLMADYSEALREAGR